jgi:RNA polymerase sigma factor (sigma-70 family)
MTVPLSPRPDGPVAALVARAQRGDTRAWDALVARYAPLIKSICRQYRLGGADTDDAAQTVWLKMVAQLGSLRDPAALPGWLATTTARECAKTLRAARRPPTAGQLPEADRLPDTQAATAEQALLSAERRAALRHALAGLPPRSRQLMALLTADPPVPYAQISATLGIPAGSIGPTRNRCLAKLRRHPALVALADAEHAAAEHKHPCSPTAATASSTATAA